MEYNTVFFNNFVMNNPISMAVSPNSQASHIIHHRMAVSPKTHLPNFSPISVTNMFIKSFLGKKGPRKGLRASTQLQGCLLK